MAMAMATDYRSDYLVCANCSFSNCNIPSLTRCDVCDVPLPRTPHEQHHYQPTPLPMRLPTTPLQKLQDSLTTIQTLLDTAKRHHQHDAQTSQDQAQQRQHPVVKKRSRSQLVNEATPLAGGNALSFTPPAAATVSSSSSGAPTHFAQLPSLSEPPPQSSGYSQPLPVASAPMARVADPIFGDHNIPWAPRGSRRIMATWGGTGRGQVDVVATYVPICSEYDDESPTAEPVGTVTIETTSQKQKQKLAHPHVAESEWRAMATATTLVEFQEAIERLRGNHRGLVVPNSQPL